MQPANPETRTTQEFEKVLSSSSTEVASFDRHEKSALERFQHFLHSSPAAVALIVLVLSIAVFGLILGGKFFSAFTLTLILQQVAITGIIGTGHHFYTRDPHEIIQKPHRLAKKSR